MYGGNNFNALAQNTCSCFPSSFSSRSIASQAKRSHASTKDEDPVVAVQWRRIDPEIGCNAFRALSRACYRSRYGTVVGSHLTSEQQSSHSLTMIMTVYTQHLCRDFECFLFHPNYGTMKSGHRARLAFRIDGVTLPKAEKMAHAAHRKPSLTGSSLNC
jgi:hypothetical protein